jgi:hypothetical protein
MFQLPGWPFDRKMQRGGHGDRECQYGVTSREELALACPSPSAITSRHENGPECISGIASGDHFANAGDAMEAKAKVGQLGSVGS